MCIGPEGCPGCISAGAYLTELLGWFCWGQVLPGPPLHMPVTHGSQSSLQRPLLQPRNRLGRTWRVCSPFLVIQGTEVSGFGRMHPQVLLPPQQRGFQGVSSWFWLCQPPSLSN